MATLSRSALAPCRHIDRLPRGGDRAVGAGYAMAVAAAVATLVCYALYTLLSLSIIGALADGPVTELALWVVGGMGLYAGVTLLLVVPSAFVAGVFVWRHAPERYLGAVGGLLATLGTYLIASVVAGLGLATYAVLAAPPGSLGSVLAAVAIYAFALFLAVAYTVWAAVPAGVVGGLLYERSRA